MKKTTSSEKIKADQKLSAKINGSLNSLISEIKNVNNCKQPSAKDYYHRNTHSC